MSFDVTTITRNIQNQASNFQDQIGLWLGKTVRPVCEKIVPTNPIVTVSIVVCAISLLAFSLYRSYANNQTKIDKLNQDNQTKIDNLNNEINKLKKFNNSLPQENSLLKDECKKLVISNKLNAKNFDSELNAERKTITKLEKEIENLNQSISEHHTNYQKLALENAKLSKLDEFSQNENKELKTQSEEKDKEIEGLSKKFILESQKLTHTNYELLDKNQKLFDENYELKNGIEDLKKQLKVKSEIIGKIKTLKLNQKQKLQSKINKPTQENSSTDLSKSVFGLEAFQEK